MDNMENQTEFETRRRQKAASFKLNIQEDYDDNSLPSYREEPEELNSYSAQEVKEQIARDSKNALKKKQRAEKRELKIRNKRNRRIFRWMWIFSVLIIGAMASVYIVTGVNDLLAVNRTDASTASVTVTKDVKLDDLAQTLYEKGIINEPSYFKMFATLTKSDSDFVQGTYDLHKNMDYQAIITNLEGNATRTDIVEVTIIEGMSVLEVADKLVEEKALDIADKDKFLELCSSAKFDDDFDFLKAITNGSERYYKLEGYLYPDKYNFYMNDEPSNIIYKFLNNYEVRMYQKQEFDGYDKLYSVHKMLEKSNTKYSLDEIMTIASIIQAEAADREDMYYISSILHNRLSADSSMGVSNLGLDSTKYYPYHSADTLPAGVSKNFVSRYDTYTKPGLPAGPICNPGMDAVKAALNPKDTSYYFFCHDKNGVAYYASTIYEHEANLEYID